MDIIYNPVDGKYHAFYKNEGDGGICKVTSYSLMPASGKATGSQWSKPSKALQQTTEAVEGAGVFKLINQNVWVLMYDCYNNGHYQFTTSSDLENFKFVQDTTTTRIAKDYRKFIRPLQINGKPVYFDLLGNRLKAKPRNAVTIQK